MQSTAEYWDHKGEKIIAQYVSDNEIHEVDVYYLKSGNGISTLKAEDLTGNIVEDLRTIEKFTNRLLSELLINFMTDEYLRKTLSDMQDKELKTIIEDHEEAVPEGATRAELEELAFLQYID